MKRIARLIPKKLRHFVYRKSIVHGFDASKNVQFKIAETKQELERAFSLIHKVYLERGWTEPYASQMKLGKIHALPSTRVLIAVENDEVKASMTINTDGAFRTPCEEYFDLTNLKSNGGSFIEISHFVFEPSVGSDFKSYFYPLAKLALSLNTKYFHAKYLVAAVISENFDYWSSLAFLNKFGEKAIRVGEQSVMTTCAFAQLRDIEVQMQKSFVDKKEKNNFFHYLFVKTDDRVRDLKLNARYSPEILDYFFNEKTNIFSILTSFESRTICKIYEGEEYSNVLPSQVVKTSTENHRHTKRYPVEMKATLQYEDHDVIAVDVKTISLNGLGVVSKEKLSTNKTYNLKIILGEAGMVDLLVSPVWSAKDNVYGFLIRKRNSVWTGLIEDFYRKQKQAS